MRRREFFAAGAALAASSLVPSVTLPAAVLTAQRTITLGSPVLFRFVIYEGASLVHGYVLPVDGVAIEPDA